MGEVKREKFGNAEFKRKKSEKRFGGQGLLNLPLSACFFFRVLVLCDGDFVCIE
jgi:hypothetical protein